MARAQWPSMNAVVMQNYLHPAQSMYPVASKVQRVLALCDGGALGTHGASQPGNVGRAADLCEREAVPANSQAPPSARQAGEQVESALSEDVPAQVSA
eukprot:scaffold1696_cov258-Pinguiococcus_pyrenoidosus.AAC.2